MTSIKYNNNNHIRRQQMELMQIIIKTKNIHNSIQTLNLQKVENILEKEAANEEIKNFYSFIMCNYYL